MANGTINRVIEWVQGTDWIPWALIAAIVAYLLNEWAKRRDHRVTHFSDEKRKVYGQLYASLLRAGDLLQVQYEFHKLLETTGSLDIRSRIYKFIPLSKMAGLQVPPSPHLLEIEQKDDHAALDSLCWYQLNAILDRSHGLGQEFQASTPEAEFLLRNRGVLRGAQETHQWLLEVGQRIHTIKSDAEFGAIIEEAQAKFQPIRKHLVADYDSDYTLRWFRRTDEWPKYPKK